jgi:phosphate/phosphite/phosphonate ABC transporter binding protein
VKDLVFALTWQKTREPVEAKFARFTRWLGARLGCKVTPRVALSYEELTDAIRKRSVDVAWLPPIARLYLEREKAVRTLLVTSRKGGASICVLLCRRDSRIETIDDLKGARAAWVDPWSAAGYVMPRVFLFDQGIDPRTIFLEERFKGSHDAAVRSVVDGISDVTATFARVDEHGKILAGGWRAIPGGEAILRVLALVGEIPADGIAASASLGTDECARVCAALQAAIADPEIGQDARGSFEIEGFRASTPADSGEGLLRSLVKAKELFPHIAQA